jgi:hypothetical protein
MRGWFATWRKIAEGNPQIGNLFLRMILPAKLGHLLRNLAPRHTAVLRAEFQTLTREALAVLAGVQDITDISYRLATQKRGGAAFCDLSLVAEPAYVAGFVAALPDMHKLKPDLSSCIVDWHSRGVSSGIPSVDDFMSAVTALQADGVTSTIEELLSTEIKSMHTLQQKLTEVRRKKFTAETERLIENDHVKRAAYRAGGDAHAGQFFARGPEDRGSHDAASSLSAGHSQSSFHPPPG